MKEKTGLRGRAIREGGIALYTTPNAPSPSLSPSLISEGLNSQTVLSLLEIESEREPSSAGGCREVVEAADALAYHLEQMNIESTGLSNFIMGGRTVVRSLCGRPSMLSSVEIIIYIKSLLKCIWTNQMKHVYNLWASPKLYSPFSFGCTRGNFGFIFVFPWHERIFGDKQMWQKWLALGVCFFCLDLFVWETANLSKLWPVFPAHFEKVAQY